MSRKTEGVQLLVQDVLATFSEPYDKNIILNVFNAIEDRQNHPEWRRRYDVLNEELSKDVVNNWIGKYVKEITGLNSLGSDSAKGKSKIITAYTKLGMAESDNL